MKYHVYALLALLLNVNCAEKKDEKVISEASAKIFESIPTSHSTVMFQNTVSETLYFNFLNYSYIYNGGGVAVGDINNDGLEDLYFTANQESNKLYINKGDFVFEDITRTAGVTDDKGWTTGVSMVDINADGWLDIYVCKSGSLQDNVARKNRLYINQKDGTFVDQAVVYGLASKAFSTQAYYLDYDKDGDLDMYLVNHRPDFNNNVTIDPKVQQQILPESTDQLFENNNGKFTDITAKAGILNKAWGLSAAVGDFNADGWPDVFVANDFLEPDFMYINNSDGTFTDKALTIFDHISANSMGSDYADLNNDLLPDLVVLDMLAADHKRSKENMAAMSTANFNLLVSAGYHHQYMSNVLQLNQGAGVYSEVGQLTGITKTDWSWAPLIADFDNDGLNDLLVTNGIEHDLANQDFRNTMKTNIMNRKKVTLEEAIGMMPSTKLSNRVFANQGDLTFTDMTEQWGLDQKINSNGTAYADLDNDGDLDLVVNNQSETASIYKNNQQNKSLTISLAGTATNPRGIGAEVTVYSQGLQQRKILYTSRGYQSSVTDRLHFGVGEETKVDSVVVHWPEGVVSVLKDIETNEQVTVAHASAIAQQKASKDKTDLFFDEASASTLGITYRHQENEYDDYARQLLVPQKQSEQGAAIAVGDVNKDGLDDFFVGNAKYAVAALYLQNPNGTFKASNQQLLEKEQNYEDKKALFFDKDNDGDLDLYVASGSYEDDAGSIDLQDRIYENDGKGNFSKTQLLPVMRTVTNTVAVHDIDQDGDLDIFVGGGVLPGQYPLASSSYLLENKNGKFIDVTHTISEGFDQLRIVQDAIFSDYDQDGDQDLMVVGEWMAPMIFRNEKGHFSLETTSMFQGYSGWYYTIASLDFDQNGRMDYLLGNIGENNKFHPTKEHPLHIYGKDFDDNGSFDVVLSKETTNGLLVPVRGKQCSSEQVPILHQKIKTFKQFATSSLTDIYGEQDLSDATYYQVENFSSLLLKNKGEGNFEISKLPKTAQFGPTMDFLTRDFDGDGTVDVFGVGSLYEAEVETVRYDAGKGYLLTTKNGQFDTATITASLLNKMQTRAMALLKIKGKDHILVLCKNEGLKVLRLSVK